ncbi:MAG: rhodanese-like domain-containing protein [Thiotrichales bacterium]
MQEYLQFAERHLFLVLGFFALLALTLWTEIRRLTRNFKDITPQETVRLMNDDAVFLLDVREDSEIGQGTIVGAKHIPLSALKARLGELDKLKGKKAVAFCRSGNRSQLACGMLKKQGFEEVYNLRGGILAWQSDNLPLKKK